MKNKDAMIAAIIKEINITAHYSPDEKIETIYFGGGTPSLLRKEDLQLILDTLRKEFTVSSDVEITLEANPDDINKPVLSEWKQLAVNRLSVGLQSFNEEELRRMNRAHSAAQSLQCLDDIEEAGFKDYSVDLIYGSPLQTNEDLKRNFAIVAQRNVPHISCYALTVEPGTKLNKLINDHKSPPVDTAQQSAQFHLLLNLMNAAGYEQYEISNFSRPGRRSRHNSSYWQGKPYYGFGPAAHSFDGKLKRSWNISNNSLYIQSIENGIIPFEEEILTNEQRLNEYVMTSLRTAEGLDLNIVEKNFGGDHKQRIEKEAAEFLNNGKMINRDSSLVLTQEGKFFADGIASEFFL